MNCLFFSAQTLPVGIEFIGYSTVVDEYFIYVVGGYGSWSTGWGASPYLQIMDTRTEQWQGQATSSTCELISDKSVTKKIQ